MSKILKNVITYFKHTQKYHNMCQKCSKLQKLCQKYKNKSKVNSNTKKSKKSILILGDYLRRNTDMLMGLVDEAEGLVKRKNNFIVKPHPSCSIDSDDYPELDLFVTNKSSPTS